MQSLLICETRYSPSSSVIQVADTVSLCHELDMALNQAPVLQAMSIYLISWEIFCTGIFLGSWHKHGKHCQNAVKEIIFRHDFQRSIGRSSSVSVMIILWQVYSTRTMPSNICNSLNLSDNADSNFSGR